MQLQSKIFLTSNNTLFFKGSTSFDKLSVLKRRDIALPITVSTVKTMVFPVVMYRCVTWTTKKAERGRIDAFKLVLEKTLLKSPLDFKEIKSVNPKRNQPWIFTARTDIEAEPPGLWPPATKSQFTGKEPNAGKDWRQHEKGAADDEMVRQNRQLNGHEFEQTPGDSGGQSLAYCNSEVCKELTQLCNWAWTSTSENYFKSMDTRSTNKSTNLLITVCITEIIASLCIRFY